MNAFMYAKALESIDEYGFIDPLTLRPLEDFYEIVDGEHRWRAGTDRGISLFPSYIIEGLSDARARKLTLIMNELRGQARPDLLTDLLRSLEQEVGLDEMLVALPFPEEVLGGFLGVDLKPIPENFRISPDKEPVTDGKKERWVERTYRLPSSVASLLDEALAKAKLADGDDRGIDDWQALEIIAAEYMAS